MRKIYKTPEVELQYKRIFKETAKRFGLSVAIETMHQLTEAEDRLANDTASAKQNSDYYFERFEYITIKNSQTIFFERINEDIIIVAAGWSKRKWKDRLDEMLPYIEQQIKKLKKKIDQ